LSSATPWPIALAIVTLPTRAAFRMPGHPTTESGRKCNRIEEVVVDAPVDDVHPLLPADAAHVQDVLVTEQVPALDQLDAHLAGQERVLEVGRVVHAGVSSTTVGCPTPPAPSAATLEQPPRVGGDRPHLLLQEQAGKTRAMVRRFSTT
jgi:hypothetical protein